LLLNFDKLKLTQTLHNRMIISLPKPVQLLGVKQFVWWHWNYAEIHS